MVLCDDASNDFGGISGNHINPAFTIALASNGLFPWAEVVPYIVAQLLWSSSWTIDRGRLL